MISLSSNHSHFSSLGRASGRPEPTDAAFLVPSEPRLPRLAHDFFADKVDDQPDHDAHKRDGIHPMDVQPEHLDPNHHAPEIPGQQADVEKGRGCDAEHERREGVEQWDTEGVADQVAARLAVPRGGAERITVENSGLGAVN